MRALPPPTALPVGRLVMIARWKPVHLGHAAVLRALMRAAEEVWIGVGSANILDARSPFTFEESAEMIRLVIGAADPDDLRPERLRIVPVPDRFDPPRWRREVLAWAGGADLFVTANREVRDLLCADLPVLHPVHLVPPEERVALNATMVRRAMAAGADWRAMVPPEVAGWLDARDIPARVRRGYGAAILRIGADPGGAG